MPDTSIPQRLLLATAGAGFLTIALSLWIMALLPSDLELAGGWMTPIIAFELARTPEDIAFLAGPEAAPARVAMDAAHAVDMVFPFAYAGLLLCLLLGRATQGKRWAWFGVLVAALIVPADLSENCVLLEMTSTLEAAGDVGPLLPSLARATWAKWSAIGLALAVLAPALWPTRKVLALLSGTSAALTLVAAVSRAPLWGEAMALAISITLGVFAVASIVRAIRLVRASSAKGTGDR